MKEVIKKILLWIFLIFFIIAFVIHIRRIIVLLTTFLSAKLGIFPEELSIDTLFAIFFSEILSAVLIGLIIYSLIALLRGKFPKLILKSACKIIAFSLFFLHSVDAIFSYQIYRKTLLFFEQLEVQFDVILESLIFLAPVLFALGSLFIGFYLERKDGKKEEVKLWLLIIFLIILYLSPFLSIGLKYVIFTKPMYEMLQGIK
jgi:hypothetical protein